MSSLVDTRSVASSQAVKTPIESRHRVYDKEVARILWMWDHQISTRVVECDKVIESFAGWLETKMITLDYTLALKAFNRAWRCIHVNIPPEQRFFYRLSIAYWQLLFLIQASWHVYGGAPRPAFRTSRTLKLIHLTVQGGLISLSSHLLRPDHKMEAKYVHHFLVNTRPARS